MSSSSSEARPRKRQESRETSAERMIIMPMTVGRRYGNRYAFSAFRSFEQPQGLWKVASSRLRLAAKAGASPKTRCYLYLLCDRGRQLNASPATNGDAAPALRAQRIVATELPWFDSGKAKDTARTMSKIFVNESPQRPPPPPPPPTLAPAAQQ